MVEGKHTNLTNYFQTLDWLLLKLESIKHKFIKLLKQLKKKAEV